MMTMTASPPQHDCDCDHDNGPTSTSMMVTEIQDVEVRLVDISGNYNIHWLVGQYKVCRYALIDCTCQVSPVVLCYYLLINL